MAESSIWHVMMETTIMEMDVLKIAGWSSGGIVWMDRPLLPVDASPFDQSIIIITYYQCMRYVNSSRRQKENPSSYTGTPEVNCLPPWRKNLISP